MAIADAVKLAVYNEALRHLGQTAIASLTEARESRRLLDGVWDSRALDHCLQKGQWRWASRNVELSYSPSVEPAFGLRYAFDKPDDFIRLTEMCSDEFMNEPLLQYRESGPYWMADIDTIWISYVSKDGAYGYDSSLWPASFQSYLSAYIAGKLSLALTTSQEKKTELKKEIKELLESATSIDAQSGPTRFPPVGSLIRARSGGSRRDRGSRSQLIG